MLKQPEGSNLCGQTCIAALADIPLPEAVEVVGKRGKTQNRDLIGALKKLKIKCAPKSKRGVPTCETAIVKVHWVGSNMRHWVVWHNGFYYDPGCGTNYKDLKERYDISPPKVVSHIEVRL